MKLLEAGLKKPLYDTWGFPHIWLPIGKAGNIYRQDGSVSYTVSESDILRLESIETLSSRPLYVWHPEDGCADLENFNQLKQAGVLTDTYRYCEGGAEVMVRITDKEVYKRVKNLELTECSPGYVVKDGIRVYNHLAILPSGMARGGAKMRIMLEGFTGVDLPTNDEFYRIGDYESNLTDETLIDEDELQTINKNIIMTVEELLGQVLANQAISNNEIAGLVVKMDGLTASQKMILEGENKPEVESEPDKMYLEGFTAGQEAGKTIAIAMEFGYIGSDVTEAEKHLIGKAFPDMKLEGFSKDVLAGVLKGATETLKYVRTSVGTVIQTEIPPAVVDKTPVGQGVSAGRLKIATK
jgi:hypothetical protein